MGDPDTSYSLISAVRRGNLERVRELISSFDLSYSQGGYVLLRDAVENKHTEVSKLLLRNGSKVNSKNKKPSNTPLHFAVINGDIEIVAMLLNRGANIDAKNQYGKTPYHNAVESKNMEIIELFLNREANVNARNNNSTALLHLAAKEGDEEIVKLLLSKGANVDAKAEDGITALHIAAERGYLQIVEHLLKHGAHINSTYTSTYREDYTPLHLATERGSEEIIKLLLIRGANVNAKETDFQNKCVKEMASMRSEKIGNSNTSFYDILTKSINQLAILLKNENIVQILRSDDYKIKFPIYASMINSHYRKGERRMELLEQVNKNCYSIFPNLPYDCTQRVLSYLSDEDLRILIE